MPLVVQKALERYGKVTGAKTNRNKASDLQLGAWKCLTLPGASSWTEGLIRILKVWFGPGLQLKKNWSELQAKLGVTARACLRRRFSSKGKAEACVMYLFPLIFYWLFVLPLSRSRKKALIYSFLWDGDKHQVCSSLSSFCIMGSWNAALG